MQFYSKTVVGVCDQWLEENDFGIRTMIKSLKVTAHGAYEGDGEGGNEKRSVTDFIRNENTWREMFGGKWPSTSPKPVINTAAKACYVAKARRGLTKFQIAKKNATEKGTKMMTNERGTVCMTNIPLYRLTSI